MEQQISQQTSYAIIGLGHIGSAIAQAFARQGIEVTVASRHPTETLAPLAAEIGSTVVARPMADALDADVIILALPYGSYQEVTKTVPNWQGKIVIDAMNAFGVPPEELGELPSSAALAAAIPGAKVVKAFNHLPAATLAGESATHGGKRVIFVSSDDEAASGEVASLVDRLGFAPVELGKFDEGGMLVQAKGETWGRLIFQDFIKFEE